MGITIPKESSDSRISEYCLVMEYLPQDLRKYIRDTGGLLASIDKKSKPILDLKAFMNICKGISIGMCYLHGSNPKIIHRDLKPANILLVFI